MVSRRSVLGLAVGIAATAGIAGCGGQGVSAPPLDAAIAHTFSNLYVLQQADQGNPRPRISALHTTANCQKGAAASAQAGAGNDWVCYITYRVDGPGTLVTATYNVTVQTNGCYAADGDGPTSLNGMRTITGADNQPVVNPLWLIDGCFDVT